MQEGRRRGTLWLSSVAKAHGSAAANSVEHFAAQGLPLTATSALDATASPSSASCSHWIASPEQHERRRSHYSASTSRGSPRSVHSTAVVSAASRISSSPAPERSFASQPAFDYDRAPAGDAATSSTPGAAAVSDAEHPIHMPQPLCATDLLGRAHASAATLKARALQRLEEVSRLERMPPPSSNDLSFRERAGLGPDKERVSSRIEQRLKRVKEVEAMAHELPAWDRLSQMFSAQAMAQDADLESSAVLAKYREEVLCGQDPEVAAAGGSSSFSHVPFLRSGMFAAQQGFSLQTDLGRLSLQSQLPPAQEPLRPVSRRTASALEGLRVVMESSRTASAGTEPGDDVSAPSHPLMRPHMALSLLTAGGKLGYNKAEEATAEAVTAAVKAERAKRAQEEGLSIDPDQAELAGWAARREEQQQQANLAKLAGKVRPGPKSKKLDVCPVEPPVGAAEVLQALAGLPGMDHTHLAVAVQGLYAKRVKPGRQPLKAPLAPVAVPEDPQAFLCNMREVAELLVQDLGAEAFVEVVSKAPWVLLLEAEKHGQPQLGCLHVIDMEQQERAEFVCAFPRLLTIDAEACLLPLLEYLQGLGMSSAQIAKCLKGNPRLCEPSSLPTLQAVAAFWLGKGMSRPDLALLLSGFPTAPSYNLNTWQLKFDWLADHVGYTVRDVALMPGFVKASLSSGFGPRVAFALSQGVQFLRPTEEEESAERGSSRGRTKKNKLLLASFLRSSDSDLSLRFKQPLEEIEAFKQQWVQHDYPAWLKQRRGSIERYRSLTGSRKRPTGAAAAAQANAARLQSDAHFWEQAAAMQDQRRLDSVRLAGLAWQQEDDDEAAEGQLAGSAGLCS